MCKYCDLYPTANFTMNIGEQLNEHGYTLSKVYICQLENGCYYLLYADFEGDNHYIPIEYCPKCGRPLISKSYNLTDYEFEIGV